MRRPSTPVFLQIGRAAPYTGDARSFPATFAGELTHTGVRRPQAAHSLRIALKTVSSRVRISLIPETDSVYTFSATASRWRQGPVHRRTADGAPAWCQNQEPDPRLGMQHRAVLPAVFHRRVFNKRRKLFTDAVAQNIGLFVLTVTSRNACFSHSTFTASARPYAPLPNIGTKRSRHQSAPHQEAILKEAGLFI